MRKFAIWRVRSAAIAQNRLRIVERLLTLRCAESVQGCLLSCLTLYNPGQVPVHKEDAVDR